MNVKRLATIVQFRATTDLALPGELIRLGCRVTTFKGAVLGTVNDGFDVIAAFHTPQDAGRFLTIYLDDGLVTAAHLEAYNVSEGTITKL